MTQNTLIDFAVVGVVKGGTTSLYHYLNQHPEVFLPPIKETNHFAAADIKKEDFLPTYAQDVAIDLDAYVKGSMNKQVHIAHVDDPAHYNALFRDVKNERAVGEISNSYMICPSSARAIHQHNPRTKIIVILRNPIRRAWSQYLMNLREAKTTRADFIEELKSDSEADKQGWGVSHQYLNLGMYYEQWKRYVVLFGSDRVLPVFYEEYRDNPQKTLSQIAKFLGVDETYQFNFDVKSNAASMPRNAALNKALVSSGLVKRIKDATPKNLRKYFAKALYSDKNVPKLSSEHSEWLRRYYAEDVNRMREFLGDRIDTFWPEFKDA